MSQSPADQRSKDRVAYVKELGLEMHSGRAGADSEFYVYLWPSEKNGTRYDRFVVIQEFSDGSAAIYLDANDLGGTKAKAVQLRRMVQE